MRILCLSVALSLLFNALAVRTAHGESGQTKNNEINQAASNQPITSEKVSSAQGGVHLLEHILQRMRNLPQLAISKNKQTIAYASQAQSDFGDLAQATNLLIKPKEIPRSLKSRQLSPAPLLASSAGGVRTTDALALTTDSRSSNRRDSSSNAQVPSIWERTAEPKPVAAFSDGAPTLPVSPPTNVREYTEERDDKAPKEEQEKRLVSTAPLITEFQTAQKGLANDNFAPSQTILNKSAKSANFVIAKKYGFASSPSIQTANPIPSGYMAGTSIRNSRGLQRLAKSLSGANIGQVISDSEANMPLTSPASSPVSSLAPKQAAMKRHKQEKDSEQNPKASWRRGEFEIALSPPTVINGITLVRLGNSEREAARAVASLGEAQKESIHGWSVWSIHRHNCSDCSIQVFIRRGMVEAIRIFDPSLLRPELGVTLGDCLSSVKEKFGEPAFILSEPAPLTTQNYIYPISQIGFQLARAKQDDIPKIVSMIVFNVK